MTACRYVIRDGTVVCELQISWHTMETPLALDPASWVDLGDGFAKDATQVVHHGNLIDGADAASFTVLRGGFAKDARTVYSGSEPAVTPSSGVWDLDSFVAFGARYVADRRGVFCIHYSWDTYDADEVAGADATDFEEVGLTFGRAPRAGVVFNNGVIADALDAATFELRGDWFAVDRNAVYHLHYGGKHTDDLGLVRIDADPSTFVVLGPHYAADQRTVFYYLNDFGDANLGVLWPLAGVAPAHFQLVPDLDGYARTGDAIFNHGVIESKIADPVGFESLGQGFARDRTHVYRMLSTLRHVDGSEPYAVDVLEPRIIDGVRPDELVVVDASRVRAGDRELVFEDDE